MFCWLTARHRMDYTLWSDTPKVMPTQYTINIVNTGPSEHDPPMIREQHTLAWCVLPMAEGDP